MSSTPSGKNKAVFLALAMVFVILGGLVTAAYFYNLQPGASIGLTQTPLALSMFSFAPGSLNILYIQQVVGATYGWITIGVGEGQGIINAKDLTTGASTCAASPSTQQCTTSSNLPAYANDQVTFTALPNNGYKFSSMIGCPTSTPSPAGTPGCTATTQNPVTVTISFSNQATPGQGSAYAYFTISGVTTTTGGAQGYINLAVAAGLGQLCATDLTSSSPLFGMQTCVGTGILYPFLVDAGDQVQFQAVPASGYVFDYMQACGGGVANSGCVTPTTANPVSATIVQQANGGYGGVFAYFSSVSSASTSIVASTSTQTTSSITVYPIFVSDICNLQPVQGATVQFHGQTQITNIAGTANFWIPNQGTITGDTTISDPDYQTYTQSVTVAPYSGVFIEVTPSGGCALQEYTTTRTIGNFSWTQTASNPIFTQPTYYEPLGTQCIATTPFHDAVLEIHIVTSNGEYIYNGINTRITEYAFGVIPLPVLSFGLGGRSYSSGGNINYNPICIQAPSSFNWVDKFTVSVAGYPSITFSWHPVSHEHSIIQVVYYQTLNGSEDVILSPQQGNPIITDVVKS